jgi:hypothetical protein
VRVGGSRLSTKRGPMSFRSGFQVGLVVVLIAVCMFFADFKTSDPAGASTSNTVYWGATTDGCMGLSDCGGYISVAAWATTLHGPPATLSVVSKDSCQTDWNQVGDTYFTSGGNYWVEPSIDIWSQACGGDGNWRISFNVQGG